jgi:hypothetical protein
MKALRHIASIIALHALARELGRTPTQEEYDAFRRPPAYNGEFLATWYVSWTHMIVAEGMVPLLGYAAARECACDKPIYRRVTVRVGIGSVRLGLCEECYMLECELSGGV